MPCATGLLLASQKTPPAADRAIELRTRTSAACGRSQEFADDDESRDSTNYIRRVASDHHSEPTGCLDETAIHGYVERTLSSASMDDVARHLRRCTDCRQLVRLVDSDDVDPT